MKNKVNIWVLTICLGVLLSISAYGQRDTIKFYPFKLRAAIKDSNAYPVGFSKDSFVITHRSELDSILKKYKVYSMILQTSPPDTNCNNNHYRQYKLLCNCNEYLLLDTLVKFNTYNNYNFICRANLIPKPVSSLQDFKEINNFKIYPNPITDYLTIENNIFENYNLQLFKINGQEVYSVNNIIVNTYKLDASNWANGVYYILMTNKSERIVKKIIKN